MIVFYFYPTSCSQDLFISNPCSYLPFEEFPLSFPFWKVNYLFSVEDLWKSFTILKYLLFVSIHDDSYGLFPCWENYVLGAEKKIQFLLLESVFLKL